MSNRDELAKTLARQWHGSEPVVAEWEAWIEYADAIIVAGWCPPARVVDTVEELEGLPSSSIIRDKHGQAWEKVSDSYWHAALWKQGSSAQQMAALLPATVLFTPTEDTK